MYVWIEPMRRSRLEGGGWFLWVSRVALRVIMKATIARIQLHAKQAVVLITAKRVGSTSFQELKAERTPITPRARERSIERSSHGQGVGKWPGG